MSSSRGALCLFHPRCACSRWEEARTRTVGAGVRTCIMAGTATDLAVKLGEYRIREDLDVFIIPDFLQKMLGANDASALQASLEENYPVRRAGEAIVPGAVQWVEGTNDALKYRGNELMRTKIWLQRGDPQVEGYAYYYYTGRGVRA